METEGPDRYVFAVGWIEAGDATEEQYGVGVDLSDTDDVQAAYNDEVQIVIAGGNITALTVYDDGESQPAWPDCHIRILV